MQYDYSATHDSWLQQAIFAKDKRKYLSDWQNRYETSDRDLKLEDFSFIPKLSDLDRLPSLSFMLRVPFKLRKPYLSKDDRTFHLIDNPVRKDKVFQTPMVASTSWKGALRAALWQMGHREENEQIIRLFGNEREEEDHKKLKSGRLYFYPTFFDKIGLEVINPHDRKKGTGKNPILIECVPIGATGELVILYVPFWTVEKNQITEEERKQKQKTEVAEDLKLVAEGVKEMLTVYGFGAKTSSGFGIAEQETANSEQKTAGQIAINCPDVPEIPPCPQEPEYPENLRLFLEQHPNEDFRLSPKEWRKSRNATQVQEGVYRDARNARSTYQNALSAYECELTQWEVQANAPPLPKTERSFNTLDQLVTRAEELAQKLKGGESNA
ncbi:MAG: hypothetical protein HC769_07195 [Cyanobacteria bacterium CRU_2_1]|nr:hypothetical protein [Cyanobacteria bacterium CRU_2_1]